MTALGWLIVRKRRKLRYPVLLFTKIGNKKLGVEDSRAGEFKNKEAFFRLWDYGNEWCIKLKDGRKILGASLSDLHDIDGKKGFLVYRKADDPKIVVPLSAGEIENEKAILSIAPADYRDASSDIIAGAIKETESGWEKYGQLAVTGGIIILGFLVILMIIQYANHQVDKAGEILKQTARAIAEASARPSPVAP